MLPPPNPVPTELWGDRWRFASLRAGELIDAFTGRMIPILHMPQAHYPIDLGLASTVAIPGVVIDGGRRSRLLSQWIQQQQPQVARYMAGGQDAASPGGLLLESAEQRWILATFEDAEVSQAGQLFETRKQLAKGLHFLLVQPDDSGMTYSGFWLLRGE